MSTQQPLPWRESATTQIWNVIDEMRRISPTKHPEDDAGLGVWLVHAPWMHSAWCWHYVGLIHLRDLPGQSKPPTITVTGATHEFLVYAVDPSWNGDLNHLEDIRFLQPVSIVQQFHAENDAEALHRVQEGLSLSVAQRLTLDSDGRSAWKRFLT